MKNYSNFPPKEAFFNTLKQTPVDNQEYIDAKAEYDRRKSLNDNHPNKMFNMGCWLAYYNSLGQGAQIKNYEHSKFKM